MPTKAFTLYEILTRTLIKSKFSNFFSIIRTLYCESAAFLPGYMRYNVKLLILHGGKHENDHYFYLISK